jgi:hypothetical protein
LVATNEHAGHFGVARGETGDESFIRRVPHEVLYCRRP